MKILAVDTSSANCSVAIAEVVDDKINIIEEENSQDEKKHSQKLMPMIDAILKNNNLKISEFDLIACGVGPGSFTGIRIGIATCKAFVDSQNLSNANKKIIACGVNSLENLAYNVVGNGTIISLIDCKNNNVYAGMFEHNEEKYNQIDNLICDNINTVLQNLKNQLKDKKEQNIIFVGDGAEIYKDLVKEHFAGFNLVFPENNIQNATSIVKCAYDKFLKNDIGGQEVLLPLYLRLTQAERQLKEKE